MRRYELSDQEWERIAPLMAGKASDCGVTGQDNRQFVNGVLWIARSGAPWRDLPERYGKWNSVYQRFNRWAKAGIWERIFNALQAVDDEWLMLDSTTIRAHQQAAGQKKHSRAQILSCLSRAKGDETQDSSRFGGKRASRPRSTVCGQRRRRRAFWLCHGRPNVGRRRAKDSDHGRH